MAWEETFGITLSDVEAGAIRTPRMATSLICAKLTATSDSLQGGCLCQRGFHRLRHAFGVVLGCPRDSMVPRARLADIIPRVGRHLLWLRLPAEARVPAFPGLLFGFGLPPAHRTVGDLARYVVANHPRSLLGPHAVWTRGQVREVVRAVITDQLGIPEFADDADFIHDLRVD